MSSAPTIDILLGIDVGEKRVGLALARGDVRIAHPLTTLSAAEATVEGVQAVVAREQATRLVVGLPRGMQGQSTAQTGVAEAFADQLRDRTGLPVTMQDEALTSVKAEAELQRRGKPFEKADVDALAATFILQDFLETVHA